MKAEDILMLFERFEQAATTINDVECWSARSLCAVLGYADWRNFVKAIDKAKSVGFIEANSWNRTSTNFYRSIVRASKIDGVTKYSGISESIETFDGLTFVLNGEYDARYETTTYLGSWMGL